MGRCRMRSRSMGHRSLINLSQTPDLSAQPQKLLRSNPEVGRSMFAEQPQPEQTLQPQAHERPAQMPRQKAQRLKALQRQGRL